MDLLWQESVQQLVMQNTYSESKGNENSSGSTANETNAVGHSVSLEHGFMLSDIISTSLGSTLSISEAKVGTNDFVTYDYSARINLALPWSYISIGNGLSFNDYVHADSSTTSEKRDPMLQTLLTLC